MYIQRPLFPAGYMQKVLGATVEEIIPPPGTVKVIIQPVDADVRLRDDRISPTATTGLIVKDGTTFELETASDNIRFSGNGATLNLTFYRET